jgi:hypothetical protein
MPDRENASFCRPRLYDRDDPEASDDVGLVLSALNAELDRAIEGRDDAKMDHIIRLRSRLAAYAGEHYRKEYVDSHEE